MVSQAMEEMGMDELDTQLFLHIGVGAGKIRCMTFGGEFDKVARALGLMSVYLPHPPLRPSSWRLDQH